MSKFFKCFKKTRNPEDGFESSKEDLKLNGYKKNKSSAKLSKPNGNHLQINLPTNGSQGSSETDQPVGPSSTGGYEPQFDSFRFGLLTTRNAPYYSMDHPLRGKAAIFNFMIFDNTNIYSSGLQSRVGSDKDARDLKACLERLSFQVDVHENLDHRRFDEEFNKLRNFDHRQFDCLVVCIMTHGDKQNIYVSDGVTYPVNLIWEGFHADKCPSLAGKPKLFFIQACRGDNYDHGMRIEGVRSANEGEVRDVTDSGTFSYMIPNTADILVAFSSPLGHYSWRDVQEGSWFIQAICKIFNEKAYDYDILTLMTFVAQEVALNRSSATDDPATSEKRQVTSLTSTLIRIMKFKPKDNNRKFSTCPRIAASNGTNSTTMENLSNQVPTPITEDQIILTNAVDYAMTDAYLEEEVERISSQV